MVKLALGVAYFNSVKEIPRLLDPIVKHVDMVIAVDGRYPLFEWPTNKSTDGSTELLHDVYNAEIAQFREPVEQIAKRDRYLEIAEKEGMDWVLVLDTDDYIHPAPINQRWDMFYSQIEKIPDEQLLANIWFYETPLHEKNWNTIKDNSWQRYTRLIRPERIRYHTTHWTYIDRDNPYTFEMPPIKAVDGCRFTCDSTLRSKSYIKSGYSWAEKQMDQENERCNSPQFKRMKYNYWMRQLKRALDVPNTKVTMDNTPDKITEKLLPRRKSNDS